MEFWLMLLKIIVLLPFILFIIYASLKFGGNKLQTIQNGKFIRILERVSLNKESTLFVVKIGQKGYVISSNNNKTEILMEVGEEELMKIEASQKIPQYSNLREFYDKLKNTKGR